MTFDDFSEVGWPAEVTRVYTVVSRSLKLKLRNSQRRRARYRQARLAGFGHRQAMVMAQWSAEAVAQAVAGRAA